MPTNTTTTDWLTALAAHPAAALIWRDPPTPHEGHRGDRKDRARDAAGVPWSRNVAHVPRTGRAACTWIAAQLRRRPGSWAVIYTGPRRHALNLKTTIDRGNNGFRYAGHYQSVVRTEPNWHVSTYARYIGPTQPTAPSTAGEGT